jgi:hypothetical protein
MITTTLDSQIVSSNQLRPWYKHINPQLNPDDSQVLKTHKTGLFDAFEYSHKVPVSLVTSICPLVRISAATTGRISVKFDNVVFINSNLVISDKNMGHFTRRYVRFIAVGDKNSPYRHCCAQWRTQEFFRGVGEVVTPGIFFGVVQQIQLREEGRESGDLGTVAP